MSSLRKIGDCVELITILFLIPVVLPIFVLIGLTRILFRKSFMFILYIILILYILDISVGFLCEIDTPPGLVYKNYQGEYRYKPKFKGYDREKHFININSYGLRDKDYDQISDKHRILILGDSVTFGDGLPVEDTVPKYLERLMENTEVINGGIRGYSTYNEYLLLKDIFTKYYPNTVIVMFVTNDVDPSNVSDSIIDEKKNPVLYSIKNFFRDHSNIYMVVRRYVDLYRKRKTPEYKQDKRTLADRFIVPYESLKNIRDYCSDRGVRLLVAIVPQFDWDNGVGEIGEIYFKVESALIDLKIPYVNLYDKLKSQPSSLLAYSDKDKLHPNTLGNSQMAIAIMEELTKEKR